MKWNFKWFLEFYVIFEILCDLWNFMGLMKFYGWSWIKLEKFYRIFKFNRISGFLFVIYEIVYDLWNSMWSMEFYVRLWMKWKEFASNLLPGSNFPASSEEEWLQYRWFIGIKIIIAILILVIVIFVIAIVIFVIVIFIRHPWLSVSRGFGLRSAHAYILVYDVSSPKVKLFGNRCLSRIANFLQPSNIFFRVLCSSSSWGSRLQFLGASVRWATFTFYIF